MGGLPLRVHRVQRQTNPQGVPMFNLLALAISDAEIRHGFVSLLAVGAVAGLAFGLMVEVVRKFSRDH